MRYDKVTFYILQQIVESSKKKKEISTWILAKNYPWEDKIRFDSHVNELNYYTKKSILIKNKLKEMLEEGLVNKLFFPDGKTYQLNLDEKRIKIKKFKFPDKIALALCVKEKDNHWSIFEL